MFKLDKKRVMLDVAKFFFSNRIIDECNMLSGEIIAENSLSGFKRKVHAISDISGDLNKVI